MSATVAPDLAPYLDMTTSDLLHNARQARISVGRSTDVLDAAAAAVRGCWEREQAAKATTPPGEAPSPGDPTKALGNAFAIAERALRRSCALTLADPGTVPSRLYGGCKCVRYESEGFCPCADTECVHGWIDRDGRCVPCKSCRPEHREAMYADEDSTHWQAALRARGKHQKRADHARDDERQDRPAW